MSCFQALMLMLTFASFVLALLTFISGNEKRTAQRRTLASLLSGSSTV